MLDHLGTGIKEKKPKETVSKNNLDNILRALGHYHNIVYE